MTINERLYNKIASVAREIADQMENGDHLTEAQYKELVNKWGQVSKDLEMVGELLHRDNKKDLGWSS